MLTVFLTVISGTLIFVSGQIINKFIIEPIHNQSKIIGEVSDTLIFYANIIHSPGFVGIEKEKILHEKLRELASRLLTKSDMIKGYSFFQKIGIVIEKSNISDAYHGLIGLSNEFPASKNTKLERIRKRYDDIKQKLNLKID